MTDQPADPPAEPGPPRESPTAECPPTISPPTVGDVTTEVPSRAAPDLPEIPGYEVEAEVARGGMGVVYRARHVALNRLVAVKMVLPGTPARTDALVRFLAEAETAARLQHHGIVQIFDSGQVGGLPYFAMEFVDGGSLADRLAAGPLAPEAAARVALHLAEAVAYAHAAGVLHRDLKPGNVLLTAGGAPKVTDFGLAKRLEVGDGVTRTGAVLGTPSYMPPEQARGDLKAVGPAADVYGVGAILYELLTGRPPFRSDSPMATLSLVLNAAPEKPRTANGAVPRDLETIALKCLEKAPANRYASAEALADDLRRYLDGRPIRARRASAAERVWRWARRNPTVAALAAAVFLSLAAGGGIATGFAIRAEHNAEQARLAARAAQDAERERSEQLWRTLIERARAGRMTGRAGQRYDGLAALAQAAAFRPTLEVRNEAIACLALVDLRPLPPESRPPGRAGDVPRPAPTWRVTAGDGGWANLVVTGGDPAVRRVLSHPLDIKAWAERPDGRLLAVGCEDNLIHVWRMPEGERHTVLRGCQGTPWFLAFDPSGKVLLSRENGGALRLWDAAAGLPLVWSGQTGHLSRFDDDGRLVGSAGQVPWEVASDRECRVLHHSTTGIRDGTGPLHRGWSVRFDSTGERLVTCGGLFNFWDARTGSLTHRVEGPNGTQAAFLSDGSWLAARNQELFRWPAAPPFEPVGGAIYALHPRTLQLPRHEIGAITEDGAWLAVADPGAARVAVVPLARAAPAVLLAQPGAYDVAFSPDGKFVATSGTLGAGRPSPVQVWEMPTGRLVQSISNVPTARLAFTPDGQWLVTSAATAYQFWRVGTWEPGLRVPRRGTIGNAPAAFSRDGRMMACMTEPLTVKLLDPRTGDELATLTPPTPASFEDLCFSPDGTKLAVATGTAIAFLWDLRLLRRQLREMGLDWETPAGAAGVND